MTPWVLAGLALAIVLLTVVIGLRIRGLVTQISGEAAQGRDELVAGGLILKAGGIGLTNVQVETAAAHFQKAEVHFARAYAALTQGRLIAVLDSLPIASRQVEAGRSLTDMGVHASRAGQLGAQILEGVLTGQGPSATKPAEGPGQRALTLLAAIDPKLDSIGQELDRVASDRRKIPSSGLIGPVSKAVSTFDSKFKLDKVRATLTSLRADEQAIQQLLGTGGARSYLVLQQDPAELRATGGFIGSVGYLNFDQGKMAPYEPHDVYEIDGKDGFGALLGPKGAPKHVDAPAPLVKTFRLQSWELRDSNWSPDLPTAAQQAEFFLNREIGRKVDGVITMDPYFISKLLSIIGPVTVPATGDVVNADNFFATTMSRIEVKGAIGLKQRFLSSAAKAIFARLLVAPPDKWYALARALQWGCDTRALQAYIHDPGVEAFIDRHQCGGQVRPLADDGVMIVDSNVGGNKDDFWLQRSFQLTLTVRSDGSVRHTLRLHYGGLTPHGFVTAQWGYTGWLRVYVPKAATIVSVQGARLDPSDELGRRVLQGWLYVEFYHEANVTIVYDVDKAGLQAPARRLEVLWQKQAGRMADPISIQVALPAGWKLQSAHVGAKAVAGDTITSDLSLDRQLIFDFQPP